MPGRENGNYKFTSRATKDQFQYNKNGGFNNKSIHKEENVDQERIGLLFVSIFSIFAVACCILTACASCVLGGIYKFHIVTKEYDIIQDLPSVRSLNLQRSIPQQVPVFQYQPSQVSHGFARGQVLMVPPNIQS